MKTIILFVIVSLLSQANEVVNNDQKSSRFTYLLKQGQGGELELIVNQLVDGKWIKTPIDIGKDTKAQKIFIDGNLIWIRTISKETLVYQFHETKGIRLFDIATWKGPVPDGF